MTANELKEKLSSNGIELSVGGADATMQDANSNGCWGNVQSLRATVAHVRIRHPAAHRFVMVMRVFPGLSVLATTARQHPHVVAKAARTMVVAPEHLPVPTKLLRDVEEAILVVEMHVLIMSAEV